MTRVVSADPDVQPNPQVFDCGCVLTCYEDDADPTVREAILSPCRTACPIRSGTIEIARAAGKLEFRTGS